MNLDMIIVNVFKAESNPRTINRTIYTSSMQIINAHKLMPFIFTPLWSYVYHSIYYFRYKRYGLREFLQKSFAVRIHKVFHLERSGQGSPGPGSPGGYLNWSKALLLNTMFIKTKNWKTYPVIYSIRGCSRNENHLIFIHRILYQNLGFDFGQVQSKRSNSWFENSASALIS